MTRTQQAAAAVVLATASVFPALAQTRALDGRSFQGVFIEKGKTSGDADTLVFRDGKFRSSACDRYGYSEAPYKAASAGDMTRFEAEAAHGGDSRCTDRATGTQPLDAAFRLCCSASQPRSPNVEVHR